MPVSVIFLFSVMAVEGSNAQITYGDELQNSWKEDAMYTKSSVGLEEAQGAIEAMLTEIRSHAEQYWQHACLAVVDERGKLVAFAKMDGAPMVAQDIAITKAWTTVMCGRDIHDLNARIATRDWNLQDFIPGGTAVVGGVAIVDPNEESIDGEPEYTGKPHYKLSCIGGIGVAGVGPYQLDLKIAKIGLQYIQEKLWPGT